MKGIIDKTVAIVLAIDHSPYSIAGFDVEILGLDSSKEKEEENILNRAVDRIKTSRGFYKFINWFRPKENEDEEDKTFEARSVWWKIEESIIPETIERIYIKNLRQNPYYVAMNRISPEGIPTKVHCTLYPGEWAYIKDSILIKIGEE